MMNARPDEVLMQSWKQQLDRGMRAVEAVIEGATRLHEVQREAATVAHADTVATHKALAEANNAGELFRLQAEWTRRNAEKSLRYWRDVSECTMQCGAEVANCLGAGNPLTAVPDALKSADFDTSRQALLNVIDNAYKQWLEASERFYRMPSAAAAESIPAAPLPPSATPARRKVDSSSPSKA